MVESTPVGPGGPALPGAFEPTSDRASATAGPLILAPPLSHGGLADADPWVAPGEAAAPPPAALRQAIWPWGLHGFAETLEVIGLALLMFVLVRGVAQNFVVDGGSMQPSFSHGEMVIVNKLAFASFDISWLPWTDNEDWRPFGRPEQGDVVVFHFPFGQDRDFIKRVVAVPGQTVEIRDGQVMVDGEILEEPYLLEPPAYRYGPETVPADHVFLLGDARNNSYDSHSWGMLEQDLIIGRADLRYWPLGEFGTVGHDEPAPQASVEVQPSP